jgi:hypothetical protein
MQENGSGTKSFGKGISRKPKRMTKLLFVFHFFILSLSIFCLSGMPPKAYHNIQHANIIPNRIFAGY